MTDSHNAGESNAQYKRVRMQDCIILTTAQLCYLMKNAFVDNFHCTICIKTSHCTIFTLHPNPPSLETVHPGSR